MLLFFQVSDLQNKKLITKRYSLEKAVQDIGKSWVMLRSWVSGGSKTVCLPGGPGFKRMACRGCEFLWVFQWHKSSTCHLQEITEISHNQRNVSPFCLQLQHLAKTFGRKLKWTRRFLPSCLLFTASSIRYWFVSCYGYKRFVLQKHQLWKKHVQKMSTWSYCILQVRSRCWHSDYGGNSAVYLYTQSSFTVFVNVPRPSELCCLEGIAYM